LHFLSEALVFNIHALRRNLYLAVDSPDRLRAPNAEMIALDGKSNDSLPPAGELTITALSDDWLQTTPKYGAIPWFNCFAFPRQAQSATGRIRKKQNRRMNTVTERTVNE
jgi:hypothetical protein